MDENLDESRRLTEAERLENMKELLGEKQAERYFESPDILAPDGSISSDLAAPKMSSGWRMVAWAAVIFVLVMIGAGAVVGNGVQVDTIDPPAPLVPR